MDYTFESIKEEHKQDILNVFNYYVINSFAAYPQTQVGEEVFYRFADSSRNHPNCVIKYGSAVIGFAFLRPYHSADAFKHTAEITYFILPDHMGKGLASQILQRFKEEAAQTGITKILASISSLNQPSINFHKKHGFREVGRFEKIGHKFDKDFDVIWMQLDL